MLEEQSDKQHATYTGRRVAVGGNLLQDQLRWLEIDFFEPVRAPALVGKLNCESLTV